MERGYCHEKEYRICAGALSVSRLSLSELLAEGGKPTWTLVAHVGITCPGHDRILVSLASAHYINGYIKANGKFAVNIVDEKILPKADYAGSGQRC